MKVIVTGTSGYIGRHTLLSLLDSGCKVYAISRRRDVDFEWPHGVRVLTVDLFDDAARQKAFAEISPKWLLHLAWYAEHGKFWEAKENIAWLALSIRMLGEFAQYGGRRRWWSPALVPNSDGTASSAARHPLRWSHARSTAFARPRCSNFCRLVPPRLARATPGGALIPATARALLEGSSHTLYSRAADP